VSKHSLSFKLVRAFISCAEKGLLERVLPSTQEGVAGIAHEIRWGSGHYNGSRPFLPAKLCLIPPFSP